MNIGKGMVMLFERHIFPCSRYATTCLSRSYDAVPKTPLLCQSGSFYIVTRTLPRPLKATLTLRKFEHVQSLATSFL